MSMLFCNVYAEQLTEKTLHASISEICVIIYFDEQRPLTTEGRESEFDMSCFSSVNPGQSSTTERDINNIKLQHLEARFQEISVDVEVHNEIFSSTFLFWAFTFRDLP